MTDKSISGYRPFVRAAYTGTHLTAECAGRLPGPVVSPGCQLKKKKNNKNLRHGLRAMLSSRVHETRFFFFFFFLNFILTNVPPTTRPSHHDTQLSCRDGNAVVLLIMFVSRVQFVYVPTL